MQRIGVVVYLIGLTLMIGDVVYGKQIQAQVATLGIAGMHAKYGDSGGVKLLLFAFSFPLGMAISIVGAALFGGTNSRAGRLAAIAPLLVLAPILIPAIFGSEHSPSFFGYGGIAILILVSAALWFWGQYRVGLAQPRRITADLQGLGLLAFALAAWNLCGFGGMPSFALYPEKMIELNAIPFAVGQLKAVMALFILGWIFTVLGLYRAARH